jgi:hypothetical protein
MGKQSTVFALIAACLSTETMWLRAQVDDKLRFLRHQATGRSNLKLSFLWHLKLNRDPKFIEKDKCQNEHGHSLLYEFYDRPK